MALEVRQYLTGTLPGISQSFPGEESEWYLSAGLNLAYHGDQGVQKSEHGAGYGIGAGIRREFWENWSVGLRLDIWQMQIQWTNLAGQSGHSNFILLQPTSELTRPFRVSNLDLIGELAAGFEVNTFRNGEPTGQGPILLIGLAAPF